MISQDLAIPVDGGHIGVYLTRPGEGNYPAVIVLGGIYGFDEELRRVTDLVASAGYVGCAINYFHRVKADFALPFTDQGRAQGEAVARSLRTVDLLRDVGRTIDWLNEQPFVHFGHIATLGFGLGGSVAFLTAELRGIMGAVAFYGQAIAKPLPSGDPAPLDSAAELRAPLLLIFGGRDEQISHDEIVTINSTLTAKNKRHECEIYSDVGHSFFREAISTYAYRQVADAWDRVVSFLGRHLT